MVLRTGSLGRELAQADPDLLELILEDYKLSTRRDKCSRTDFAMGWLAASRRLLPKLREAPLEGATLPW